MPKQLPSTPNLEHLKKQAKQLVNDHQAGQVEAFNRIKASFPRLVNASVHEIIAADFSLCNAQLVIAREYGLATWKELIAAVEAPDKDAFVGENPGLDWVRTQIAQIAPSDLPVLVLGESGTGKGLVARAIHQHSSRTFKGGSFVQIDCSATPEILIESELFGHEQGAFTGAQTRRTGKVEVARGGTLFLDQIDALTPSTQAKLLRLLEEGSFERVGGNEVLASDVRIVAATNRDLEALVEEGAFRRDLAMLLQKLSLTLQPLRERREDIPVLAAHFIAEMAAHLGKETPQLSSELAQVLQRYDWPGNVRELEHRVQRAVAVAAGPSIGREDLALE